MSAVGLAARLLYLFLFNDQLIFPDEHRFWHLAQSLAGGGPYEWEGYVAHDMPLTALLLALVIKITGAGLIGAKVFVALLSSVTIYVIGRIALLLEDSKLAAWLAGISAAIYPFFVFYSTLILSETLFLLLVALFFLLLLRASGRDLVLAGLIAGLAHLTRPTMSYFLPIALIWSKARGRAGWKHVLAAAALFIFAILPWGIRNTGALGAFHLSTANSGHVLWEGNNPYNVTGGVAGGDLRYLEEMPAGLDELGQDRWQRDRAVAFILEHPGRFVRLALKKFVRFWNIWPNAPGFDRGMYRWVAFASFTPVLMLALSSFYVLRTRWRQTVLVWLFICYYTAIHMVTIGSLRYRLPLEPLLLALAAAGLAGMLSRRSKSARMDQSSKPSK